MAVTSFWTDRIAKVHRTHTVNSILKSAHFVVTLPRASWHDTRRVMVCLLPYSLVIGEDCLYIIEILNVKVGVKKTIILQNECGREHVIVPFERKKKYSSVQFCQFIYIFWCLHDPFTSAASQIEDVWLKILNLVYIVHCMQHRLHAAVSSVRPTVCL